MSLSPSFRLSQLYKNIYIKIKPPRPVKNSYHQTSSQRAPKVCLLLDFKCLRQKYYMLQAQQAHLNLLHIIFLLFAQLFDLDIQFTCPWCEILIKLVQKLNINFLFLVCMEYYACFQLKIKKSKYRLVWNITFNTYNPWYVNSKQETL